MEKRGIKSQKRKILIIEASKEDYRKIEEILSGIYRVKQLLPGEEHLLLAIEEYYSFVLVDHNSIFFALNDDFVIFERSPEAQTLFCFVISRAFFISPCSEEEEEDLQIFCSFSNSGIFF